MSNISEIQQFLVGKTFKIPPYQRNYAWTPAQVNDLLDDIQEAIDTGSSHYLGTVVLAQEKHKMPYEIVDGQQRLTTITLVIHALLEELKSKDSIRIADTAILLNQGATLKIDFGNNSKFIKDIFNGLDPTPTNAGQRKLRNAYSYARDRGKVLTNNGGDTLVKKWLQTIKTLEIIQFVASDTGRAIRMFQTVNDRGLQLSAMDKAKAILVFYSNRYLKGSLDNDINSCFGVCFSAFDSIREFVRKPGFRIGNIARDNFSEDDILRYHYLSYTHNDAVDSKDYEGSIKTVFESFLKGTLKSLSPTTSKLQSFIENYINDLKNFSDAFKNLVLECQHQERLYRLFIILGLSARMYPLIIRLYQRSILFSNVPHSNIDLLTCIEICDIRVYKTRGTDPAKDIGNISHAGNSMSVSEIADSLKRFVIQFMPDGYFQSLLSQDMYHNGSLTVLLLGYDEKVTGTPHSILDLIGFAKNQITREHIIAQIPSFSVTAHGFSSDQEFEDQFLHTIGNLTLLTKSENSRCRNLAVHTKMTDPSLYTASSYALTRNLAHQYSVSANKYNKQDLLNRTDVLVKWILAKWKIW